MPASQTKAGSKKAGASKASAKKTVRKKAAVKKSGKSTAKKSSPAARSPKKWSRKVTETSDAMDLREGIFKSKDPKKIAKSVKESAEKSKRKKAGPFQSAMSMINFYENRGGKNLTAAEKKILDQAKEELRVLFGREES